VNRADESQRRGLDPGDVDDAPRGARRRRDGRRVHGYLGKAHNAASEGAVLAWTRTVPKEWGRGA